MAFSLATLTRVLVATTALLGNTHAKGVDAPSPWGAEYAPDVVEPGTVEGTPKSMKIFGAPTFSDSARLAADFFIRAMPLGASITQGVASTDGNGYRKYFRDQLRFNGWKVNMVGSKQDGTMNDRDNEGHPGWIIDEVYDAARRSIGLHPNLVMINVGTNDCIRNLDTGNAGARLRRLVDYLFAEIPGTTVLLSTLVPSLNDDNERCAQSVNAQYRSLVSSYSGKRIFLADMHAFLTRSDIDSDGIHPNNGGYKKMASVWWDAFKAAERTLQAPDESVDDAREVSGEPSTCAKRADQGRGPVQTQLETGYANGNYKHESVPRGTMATVPNSQSNTYVIAQLVNAGGAGRGGEVDELVRIERQGDGSHRYSYLLNVGGRFQNSWTGFSVPACNGNVKHIFADLNNDGLDDFWCIGDRGQASVAINRGGQPPRFESIGEVIGAPGGKGPGDVLVADVDGDGRADYCVQENNGDIRCWRNGGMGDTVAYWQGFMSENTGGDVVLPGRGTANKYMVRLGDINGDWRADWMYIGDRGEVDTVINQRGFGLGIKPYWLEVGRTHNGMGVAGAGAQIRFGRVFGSGRLDYIWLKPAGNNIEVVVYENIGDGGQRMKGDGTFYCDMTGSGSDDYIWVWSGGDKAELRINTHNPPNWQEGLPNLFNIQRNRRSIHLADWDGDGKCDILSQNQATGDLEMWRNEYNPQTGRFSFPYVGRVNGPAQCSEGWGVNIFDRGLRLADIDGDGRADYLCLEKDGRVTGALNKAGGMENVGQIKFAEGWDRANIRFADVEKGGKADMIWLNKYNGAATVLKNKGRIPAGGSAFTWEKRGVLYNSVGERGLNMNFANLGGLGRADFVQVLPITNRAYTWFNECPGGNGGGGDDGAIGNPQLPPYGNNRRKALRFRRL